MNKKVSDINFTQLRKFLETRGFEVTHWGNAGQWRAKAKSGVSVNIESKSFGKPDEEITKTYAQLHGGYLAPQELENISSDFRIARAALYNFGLVLLGERQ